MLTCLLFAGSVYLFDGADKVLIYSNVATYRTGEMDMTMIVHTKDGEQIDFLISPYSQGGTAEGIISNCINYPTPVDVLPVASDYWQDPPDGDAS